MHCTAILISAGANKALKHPNTSFINLKISEFSPGVGFIVIKALEFFQGPGSWSQVNIRSLNVCCLCPSHRAQVLRAVLLQARSQRAPSSKSSSTTPSRPPPLSATLWEAPLSPSSPATEQTSTQSFKTGWSETARGVWKRIKPSSVLRTFLTVTQAWKIPQFLKDSGFHFYSY